MLMGDSGAGKSESIEALKALGHDKIKDIGLLCGAERHTLTLCTCCLSILKLFKLMQTQLIIIIIRIRKQINFMIGCDNIIRCSRCNNTFSKENREGLQIAAEQLLEFIENE